MIETTTAALEAERIIAGGRAFRDAVLSGLADRGYDIKDPFELFLALRRIGARRLESAFGAREPLLSRQYARELDEMAARRLETIDQATREAIAKAGFTALLATSDVHEHGKTLLKPCAGTQGSNGGWRRFGRPR